MKRIIITGITGQDGPYMAERCLQEPNIEVFGVARRTAQIHDINYRHLLGNPRFKIVRGDLLDGHSLAALVQELRPDYFANFAAQSFVGDSWKIPEETFMVTAVGVLKCLEAIRRHAPHCRFYNAGSSEQFGDVIATPQTESHPFRPRSPYGAAKCAAHHLVKVYRESYNLYAVQGMLFNHESEHRGEEFVTRKITKGFARIAKAAKEGNEFAPIHLGNLNAKRDWSHAADFMDAVWRMLNQDIFNDKIRGTADGDLPHLLREYVVASGQTHTIRDFINACLEYLSNGGWRWVGEGINERLIFSPDYVKGRGLKSNCIVQIDPAFYRPNEVELLLGDPTAIKKDLGWQPTISFDNLVKRMLEYDLNELGLGLNGPKEAPQAAQA